MAPGGTRWGLSSPLQPSHRHPARNKGGTVTYVTRGYWLLLRWGLLPPTTRLPHDPRREQGSGCDIRHRVGGHHSHTHGDSCRVQLLLSAMVAQYKHCPHPPPDTHGGTHRPSGRVAVTYGTPRQRPPEWPQTGDPPCLAPLVIPAPLRRS